MSKQYEPLMTTEFMVNFKDPKTLKEQIEEEKNFNDKEFLDKVNSEEFKEKLNKASEKILNIDFETGE